MLGDEKGAAGGLTKVMALGADLVHAGVEILRGAESE
jgi:hypothetical protein